MTTDGMISVAKKTVSTMENALSRGRFSRNAHFVQGSLLASRESVSEHMALMERALGRILSHDGSYDMRYPVLDHSSAQALSSLHVGGLGIPDLRALSPTIFLAAYRETCRQLYVSLGHRYQTINDAWLHLDNPTVSDLKNSRERLIAIAPDIASASRPL